LSWPGPDAEHIVRRATAEAAALDVPLDVRLSVDSPDRIGELLDLLPLDSVVRVAVFDASSHVTEPELWDELTNEARGREFTGVLLAGARSHFTELLQPEPFTAAWLLGSIAALSVPGVESLSYFEATGPRGICGPGGLTPAGELLAAVAAVGGCEVLDVAGGVPGVVLYPVRDGGRPVLFAANLTAKPLSVVVRLPGGGSTNLEFEPWTTVVRRFD
jgi:hypothetical protein